VLLTAVLALLVYAAAKAVERRNPPIGNFLEVEGTRLHYFERGGGLPVVFLHGNGTMLQDFSLSEAFVSTAKQNRAIAFDRPGFGYSTRPRARNWTASEQADVLAAAVATLELCPRGRCRPLLGYARSRCPRRAAPCTCSIACAFVGLLLSHSVSFSLLDGRQYRFDADLVVVGTTPVIGDILRYTLTPLMGLLMLPVTLRVMFAPCAVPELFGLEFPRLMMLRPWQLRASLGDGAMMLQATAELQKGYSILQVPTFIAAGGDDRVVDHWHS
jgi:pimeloyl-ACP methyl ester carboxylesterase